MGDHGHYHGNLHASTVDAQFGLGRFRGAVHQREDDFVGRLVQDARDTENQDGPTVAQHTFHQPGVEPIFESCQFGNEEEGDERCTDKVQDEGISRSDRRVINCAHPCVADVQCRKHDEIKDVQRDVEHDEQHLQREKLDRTVLVAQPGKGNGLKGIQGYRDRHDSHIFRMVCVAYAGSYRMEESQYEQGKQQRQAAHHGERRAIDRLRIFPLFVGKTEQRGFHAERKDDHQKRHVGINVGHDAIASAFHGHLGRIERDQQIVQELSDDAA